jgi:hypothetical protein
MTLPSSPAFSIIDVEPAAVMKPATNRDLAADVLSAINTQGQLVPNLGLEFSPYWLRSRSTLTRSQYLHPDFKQTLLQTLAFSAATRRDSTTGVNKLGIGFRVRLVDGRPVDSLQYAESTLNQHQKIQAAIAAIPTMAQNGLIDSLSDAIDFVKTTLSDSVGMGMRLSQLQIQQVLDQGRQLAAKYQNNELAAFAQAWGEAYQQTYQAAADRVATLSNLRKGWVVELAGASAFANSQHNELDRMGFWASISNYVTPQDVFSFTARYQWTNADSAITRFDAGLSYLKQMGGFNLALEALARWYGYRIPDVNQAGQSITRSDGDFTYRLSLQSSYEITRGISVNLSLGKGFNDPFVGGSAFFSLLGFNYTIFHRDQVALPASNP